ncbi:RNA polymerase ECF family sigma subunit [Tamaricihabitans halophyticus]|uniref:RNA polymerase sigma factor n=1 Tax=Tamaricihabitans halophyticus TaxID=1262583 RepID=A0A4R2R353_9PSEU|nr:sigma-70 family RNA polymerase sigma factor [Tamaricihabitans halophyticus]TCP57222.1 RNA polymerase ECF family sigma subunit [Tamaricihabitans halophyticus]
MSTPTIDDSFMVRVEPLRKELTAHCYRMVGSVHEAEDLVQETYLNAWRGFGKFENRSSLRTWLYQIATNTCLSALRGKHRRPLPTGLGQPSSDPHGELPTRDDLHWLEPLPDSMVWGNVDPDPADEAIIRDSVRLAFVAALQHLTPQQRAVVLLCDVLSWRAKEAAAALGVSVAAVNSSLQRARAQLSKQRAAEDTDQSAQHDRQLLDKYVAAFEDYDVDKLVTLLTDETIWEMPPFTGWFQGAEAIGALVREQCPAKRAGDMRILRTSGNGQPVLAVYLRDADDEYRPFQLHQLTLGAAKVAHVVCYFDTSLFATFGLPETL